MQVTIRFVNSKVQYVRCKLLIMITILTINRLPFKLINITTLKLHRYNLQVRKEYSTESFKCINHRLHRLCTADFSTSKGTWERSQTKNVKIAKGCSVSRSLAGCVKEKNKKEKRKRKKEKWGKKKYDNYETIPFRRDSLRRKLVPGQQLNLSDSLCTHRR